MKIYLLLLIPVVLICQNNYAIDFDGDDYLDSLGTNIGWYDHETGFVSIWLRPDRNNDNRGIWSIGDNTGSGYFLTISQNSDGTIRVAHREAGGTVNYVHTDDSVRVNQNNHIIIGSNGTSWVAWINGASQTLSVQGGSNTGDWTADLTLAVIDGVFIARKMQNINQDPYYGIMDEYLYSSSVPSEAIATNIYNNGAPKDESNNSLFTAVEYCRFEEGTGAQVYPTVGSDTLDFNGNPQWVSSPFGWDAGDEQAGFNRFDKFNGYKGY